jgi:hypothetical protein
MFRDGASFEGQAAAPTARTPKTLLLALFGVLRVEACGVAVGCRAALPNGTGYRKRQYPDRTGQVKHSACEKVVRESD